MIINKYGLIHLTLPVVPFVSARGERGHSSYWLKKAWT